MKVNREYLVVLNHITNEVCLSRVNSEYDNIISGNELGFLMFDCTLSQAKTNIRVGIEKGFRFVVKKL